MALLDGLLGNASEIDGGELQAEFEKVLAPGERIEKAYKLIRDLFIFTDKRLILVDKQGVTGSKADYHTIPYERIVRFSKESAGIMDLEAELKIWIVGQPQPITKTFTKNQNVNEVYQLLSKAVLE